MLATWALAAGGAARVPGCSSYRSQAAAQERFVQLGGGPSRDVEGLDGDGDGVACEARPGPYEGFATIGYNRKRSFFYGEVAMPPSGSGGGFACLSGNRHFAEGPRLLKVYRALSGTNRSFSRTIAAEAKPDSGHLVWKLDKELVPGSYYVSFEEQQRLSPYKPTECPGFRSRETRLPQPPARVSR